MTRNELKRRECIPEVHKKDIRSLETIVILVLDDYDFKSAKIAHCLQLLYLDQMVSRLYLVFGTSFTNEVSFTYLPILTSEGRGRVTQYL